jgi:hypothetical protein
MVQSKQKPSCLAASIRAHFEPQIELIAAHPRNAGDLSVETTQALKHLDVHIRPIRNPLHADYPIGQKLVALALTAGPGLGIFLDSDILAMRRPTACPTALGMVPASRNHHDRRVWERAYGTFGLLPPKAKAPPILTGDATAPYFNAGMIAVPGPLVSRLAKTWINTALKLDGDHAIPLGSKRPYLDQLSTPSPPPASATRSSPSIRNGILWSGRSAYPAASHPSSSTTKIGNACGRNPKPRQPSPLPAPPPA